MQKNRKVYYLDTNYFIFYLQGKTPETRLKLDIEKRERAKTAKEVIDFLSYHKIAEFRISVLALGELFSLYASPSKGAELGLSLEQILDKLEQKKGKDSSNFSIEVRNSKKEDLPRILELLNKMLNDDQFKESRITDATDYLLLAIAYADEESSGFLTFDRDLTHYRPVKQFMKEKGRSFIITEDPRNQNG